MLRKRQISFGWTSTRSEIPIQIGRKTNLLLTEREGRTGEYWPEVVAVRTERSEVRTETTEGQYSPVRLELARLVSSLLYGIRAMLVLNLPAFENKKYTAYDRFHGNGPYGEIPLGFALPYNNIGYVNSNRSSPLRLSELKTRKLWNDPMSALIQKNA